MLHYHDNSELSELCFVRSVLWISCASNLKCETVCLKYMLVPTLMIKSIEFSENLDLS